MRLVGLKLRNFRCYKDETSASFADLTAFVGRNDSGKSSIMDALSIFFEDGVPEPDDASVGGHADDIRITCEFDGFPASLVVDADFETSLADEHLLNESGCLEIEKRYSASGKKGKLTGVFAKCLHPSNVQANDLLELRIADLKKRARDLEIDLTAVDQRVSAHLRRAIWASAGALVLAEREVRLDAEGAKQIWEFIKKHMPAFALFRSDRPSTDQDEEAQDPMKAAVKEAIKAKEADLAAISAFVENEVKAIAARTIEKVQEMDPALGTQLTPRFTPPNWASVFKISLTGDQEIPVNKRGSGVRRLILLNFFRAKAEGHASEQEAPDAIYAIEEPETSQHPNNQRMLLHALSELSQERHCRVIISTHTPMLGRLLPAESLRYIEATGDGGRSIRSGDEDTLRLVSQSLGVLPDHDVRVFVGVEGTNDINFLCGMSQALLRDGADVPDLKALEDAGRLVFIPVAGSNLALWKSRLAGLNIPEVHIFDRDIAPPGAPPHQATVDAMNGRNGCTAYLTSKREMENYLHPDAIRAARPAVTVDFGDFDDVPAVVAECVHVASAAPVSWDELGENKRGKKVSQAKKWLNSEAVRHMTRTMLNERDREGDILRWLAKIQGCVADRAPAAVAARTGA